VRIAALIFGLLAGLCGIGVEIMGNIEPDLAANALLGDHADTIARAALLGLPALAFFAAGLALGAPRFAGFLLLLAAIGWAAIAWFAGHGAVFLAALPFTFAAAAGLVALFGRRRTEEAIAAPPLMAEGAAIPAARPGHVALRSEPEFGPAAPRPTNTLVDDPVAEALVTTGAPVIEPSAVPAGAVEAPHEPALETHPRESSPSESPLEPPPAPAAHPAELPPIEPRLAAAPAAPSISEPVPTPERTPPEPAPVPTPPAPAMPAVAAPIEPPPVPPAEPEPTAIDPRYEELPRDERPRRGEGLRRTLRFLIALIFLAILVAIIVAIYMDYRRGPQSALFGDRHAAAATVPDKPAAAPTTPPAPAAAPISPPLAPAPAEAKPAASNEIVQPPTPAPQAAAVPTALQAMAVAEATPTTPAPASDAAPSSSAAAVAEIAKPAAAPAPAATSPAATPPPPPPAVVTPATVSDSDAPAVFNDPLAYCHAVGTIDGPDGRFNGPAVPPLIGLALQQANGGVQGPIHWRCENGDVRACDSRGRVVCELTPSVDEMLAYCGKHPDTKDLPAPNGSWSCKGKKPVIPPGQKWPVDARGFFPDAWVTIKLGAAD
jgi:hypothetical protein